MRMIVLNEHARYFGDNRPLLWLVHEFALRQHEPNLKICEPLSNPNRS